MENEDAETQVDKDQEESQLDSDEVAKNQQEAYHGEIEKTFEDSGENVPEKAKKYKIGSSKGKLIEHVLLRESIRRHEYERVVEHFNRLTDSLRLLRMRRKLSTFGNVACQVSSMTKRPFFSSDLAQIKYIIPEAINIDYVSDEKTACFKSEMIINLNFDIVQGHSEVSDFVALRKVFASRVTEYFATHPERIRVPEGPLPPPFNPGPSIHRFPAVCSEDCGYDLSEEISYVFDERSGRTRVVRTFVPCKKAEISEADGSSVVGSSSVDLPSAPAGEKEDNNDNLLEDFPAQSTSPQAAANSSESPC